MLYYILKHLQSCVRILFVDLSLMSLPQWITSFLRNGPLQMGKVSSDTWTICTGAPRTVSLIHYFFSPRSPIYISSPTADELKFAVYNKNADVSTYRPRLMRPLPMQQHLTTSGWPAQTFKFSGTTVFQDFPQKGPAEEVSWSLVCHRSCDPAPQNSGWSSPVIFHQCGLKQPPNRTRADCNELYEQHKHSSVKNQVTGRKYDLWPLMSWTQSL